MNAILTNAYGKAFIVGNHYHDLQYLFELCSWFGWVSEDIIEESPENINAKIPKLIAFEDGVNTNLIYL